MVSHPIYSAIFICFSNAIALRLKETVRNFGQNFAQMEGNRLKYSRSGCPAYRLFKSILAL